MYYSSAASHDMISFRGTSVASPFHMKGPRTRGYRKHRSFVLSAFFFSAIIFALVLYVPASYSSNRDIAEDYRRQGYDAQQSDEYSKALGFYYKAAALDPKDASYWNDIGLVYEMMGERLSAEKAYLTALGVDPNYLAPYANLGHLYHRQQNTVKAVDYFQKRLDLGDPSDPWTQKARKDLEDIYSASPLYRERFMNAETKRLNLQASQQTRENFKNQMRIASSEYERGIALLEEQRPKEALKALTASLSFAPQNPKTIKARDRALRMVRAQRIADRVQKAMHLINEGNEQAAKQQFTDILAIFPN